MRRLTGWLQTLRALATSSSTRECNLRVKLHMSLLPVTRVHVSQSVANAKPEWQRQLANIKVLRIIQMRRAYHPR